jgi:hypothetical protein
VVSPKATPHLVTPRPQPDIFEKPKSTGKSACATWALPYLECCMGLNFAHSNGGIEVACGSIEWRKKWRRKTS